jgi:hypothetical protein
MSNAALRAQSAISCFSQVRSAAFGPAGLKRAEGLLALSSSKMRLGFDGFLSNSVW